MKRAIIDGFGKGGFNTDLAPWDVPANTFTGLSNVRTHDGAIGNINCGYTTWYADLGGVSLDIIYCGAKGIDGLWATAQTNEIKTFDGSVLSTGHTAEYWTSTILTGVPVWNNYKDIPLYWSVINAGTPLTPIPWDATHDWDDIDGAGTKYRAGSIRAHKNFLFAMDIYEGAAPDYVTDRMPTIVHWSELADPGYPPPNWSYADPTSLSGRIDLGQTPGACIDGASLADDFIVYKSDGAWRFTFTRDEYVFRPTKIRAVPGIMSRDCVVEVEGLHYVMYDTDIYVTDGNSFQSLLDDRARKIFLALADPSTTDQNFVQFNTEYKEVWFCLVTSGSGAVYPNVALVWSIRDSTWTVKNFMEMSAAAEGQKDPSGAVLINDYPGLIKDANRLINQLSESPNNYRLIGAFADGSLVEFDTGPDNDGQPIDSRLTRTMLDFDDAVDFVTVDRGYPHFTWLTGDSVINIRIGSHRDTQQIEPSWGLWKQFDIKNDRHVGLRKTGSYHALDIQANTVMGWSITGILVEYQPSGMR